ncbi:hypothetical protein RCC89_05150 [Cytophagaceae bacterium ABcell3]|nr:hypothetical protein RCC89_05150 [Cytophagaceae bacterium ABcell3]
MGNVIEKDLLSYILKLEIDQQKQVLSYVKELLEKERLNQMADDSEKAIDEGRVLTMTEFKAEADKWIRDKNATK